jgi:hypothetical protein
MVGLCTAALGLSFLVHGCSATLSIPTVEITAGVQMPVVSLGTGGSSLDEGGAGPFTPVYDSAPFCMGNPTPSLPRGQL